MKFSFLDSITHAELDFYQYCVQACQERGIFSISDLQNRILSKEDYQTKWLDWCQREARKFDKS